MDFSWVNRELWSGMLQVVILCLMMLLANLMHRKIPWIRKSLMPTAVLAGFLLLFLRYVGLFNINTEFMEMVTYHALGLGFIALSLRVPQKTAQKYQQDLVGPKSGALIASCYVLQAIVGLIISMGVAYTVSPGFFKAAGILLPMGYGQGPGQANNIGSTYEQMGFAGGQSFGLGLAAAGLICACVVGVFYLNVLRRQGKIKPATEYQEVSGSVTVDTFQDENEIPIAESVDRFTMNMALVLVVYGVTYLFSRGFTSLFSGGLGNTISTLVWGFNFLIGSMMAIALRSLLGVLRKARIINHQYQNNYLLSRCAGGAFDLMVIAGIGSIEFSELQGSWLPFLLMAVIGGIVTFYYLLWICKKLYPNYYYEGFFSMFGMMTGTLSSGILLLREVDNDLITPAANNLLLGTSFAVLFGAPILVVVGIAPQSDAMCWLTLGLVAIYMVLLLLFMLKVKGKKK